MRNERKKQVMTLSILLVAVLVISIGFAAFSSILRINTDVTVNPNATDFKVVFSKSSNSIDESDVTPTLTPDTITASNGEIDNTTTPTLSILSVDFTSPGQKAVYNLYVYNAGEYEAFLNSVMLQGNKSCTSGEGASASLVEQACEDIIVSVKIDNDSYTETTTGITGKSIQKGQSTPIEITIEYLSDGDRADGPFSVEFNDISLYYATVNGINEEVQEESETLYTGTIYRNSEEVLGVGNYINTNNRWCAVSSELGNTCVVNGWGIFLVFNSKIECETGLEEAVNSGEFDDEQQALLSNAVCEQNTTPISYETTPLNINKTYYLKHEVENNIVTASYACITYTEDGIRKDVCLRGGDPSYYVSNQSILRSAESYFNTLSYGAVPSLKGYCNFDDSVSDCSSDSFYLTVDSDGTVSAAEGWTGSGGCDVFSNGSSFCG